MTFQSNISLVFHWLFTLFIEKTCAYKSFSDCVRIAVGWGTTVFKVALHFLAHRSWDSDASTTVSHSSRELVDVGGLVMASQSSGIVQPSFRIIGTNMVLVPLGQPLNRLLNVSKMKINYQHNQWPIHVSAIVWGQDSRLPFTHLLQTPFLTHLLRAEVGVAASSIPVPWNGLGVERGHNAKVLTNPMQEEAGDP